MWFAPFQIQSSALQNTYRDFLNFMCVCECVCTLKCRYPWRPKEGDGKLEFRDFELPNRGALNWTWVLSKSSMYLLNSLPACPNYYILKASWFIGIELVRFPRSAFFLSSRIHDNVLKGRKAQVKTIFLYIELCICIENFEMKQHKMVTVITFLEPKSGRDHLSVNLYFGNKHMTQQLRVLATL